MQDDRREYVLRIFKMICVYLFYFAPDFVYSY